MCKRCPDPPKLVIRFHDVPSGLEHCCVQSVLMYENMKRQHKVTGERMAGPRSTIFAHMHGDKSSSPTNFIHLVMSLDFYFQGLTFLVWCPLFMYSLSTISVCDHARPLQEEHRRDRHGACAAESAPAPAGISVRSAGRTEEAGNVRGGRARLRLNVCNCSAGGSVVCIFFSLIR